MIEWIRLKILNIARPALEVLGKAQDETMIRRRVNSFDVLQAKKVLEPGFVIITRKLHNPTNLVIPGFYTHAGIFAGDGVVEAIDKGVVKTPLEEFLRTKDYFCILESKYASDQQNERVASEALNLIGRPYDYGFHPSNMAFYCSELVWYCYYKVIPHFLFIKKKTLGVPTITAQDFYNATKKWNIIYQNS